MQAAGRRGLIFANGEQLNHAAMKAIVRPGDYLVAVDGGLHHMQALGLRPDLLIGDLDSLAPAEVEALRESGVEIKQYPVHKDETDLELAVEAAVHAGCTALVIAGALGGRLDMTLANLFLLGLPSLDGVDARLEDGVEEVFLIRPGGWREITGRPGERVSLLPLGDPAHGVRTVNLFYPLNGETLYPERTRGISNRLVEANAQVRLDSGVLICIHSRQMDAGEADNEGEKR